MRVFFSLRPSQVVQRALWELQASLSQAAGRPVPAENFHMTLSFLGEVSANVIDTLVHLAETVHHPQFQMRLDEIGFFARPAILFVGPSSPPQRLTNLVRTIRRLAYEAGVSSRNSKFVPHVTLYRQAKFTATNLQPNILWKVTHFELTESILSANGSRYQTIAAFPLIPKK